MSIRRDEEEICMLIGPKKQLVFIFILNLYFISNQAAKFWTYTFVKTPTGALSKAFLEKVKTSFNSKIFIETGTCTGATATVAAEIYDQVLTVELDEQLYQLSLRNLSRFSNVTACFGSSVEFLKNITNYNINLNNATFWLDAHWSGGDTAKNGAEHTPVASELDLVANAASLPIILIDDIRFFQPNIIQTKLDHDFTGYPSVQELQHKIMTLMPSHQFIIYGDIAIIFPKINSNIIFSDTILNMTTSLLYFDDNDNDLAKNAELNIAYKSTYEERQEIIKLYESFKFQPLLIEHLGIWYAMVKIGQRKYREALETLTALEIQFDYRKLKRLQYYKELCELKLRKR